MSNPMDLTYMKMIRMSLHFLNSWPYAMFNQTRAALPLRHSWFLRALYFLHIVSQLLYIKNNIRTISFLRMGNNYLTTLMTITTLQRLTMVSMKTYQEGTKMFVAELHLHHHRHRSDYAMKIYKLVHRICSFFCYLNHTQIVITPFLFNAAPLINNCRAGIFRSDAPANGTYELSVYYQVPFDYEYNFIGYLTMSLSNLSSTFDVGCAFGLFDLYLSIIVFHTWGHLKILKHSLRNFPRPEMVLQDGYTSSAENPPWYTPEESEVIARMLKENVDHHRLVMNFVNLTTRAFGPMLGVYYAFHQICCCILLLECSTLDSVALGKYLLLTVVMFQQLMQLSIIFELIGSQSDTLADAVYSVPWECMRDRERKTVLLFLRNVQTPISLKALGLVPVGVRTMATVIKTSLSYFVMFRTFTN